MILSYFPLLPPPPPHTHTHTHVKTQPITPQALYDKMCDCAHYPTSAKMPQLLGLLDFIKASTIWLERS